MAYDTPSVFDVLETDNTNQRVASRQALALAHKRVEANLGRFLRAAQSEDEFFERLALVQEDFAGFVTTASVEVGHEHPEHIAAALRDSYRLAAGGVEFAPTEEEEEEEDENGKKKKKFPFSSSVREARRPRMCPYHNEVVNASLGTGDPKAGYDAMAQHAWSTNHCQGSDYEGPSCKFKPEMVTQSFWDGRAQQAEERRQVIPQDEVPALEAPSGLEAPADEAPVSDSEPIDTVPEGIPSDSGEMSSEPLSEAPEATLEPVAASWQSFSHIGGVNMLDPINQPGAGTQQPGVAPGLAQPGQQAQPGMPPQPGLDPQNPQNPQQLTPQQLMQQQLMQQQQPAMPGLASAGGQSTQTPLVHPATERNAADYGGGGEGGRGIYPDEYSVPAPSENPRHLLWQAPLGANGEPAFEPCVHCGTGRPDPHTGICQQCGAFNEGKYMTDRMAAAQDPYREIFEQPAPTHRTHDPSRQVAPHAPTCWNCDAPLPHEGYPHCVTCGQYQTDNPALRGRNAAAQDPGEQNDDAGRKVSCPECGGDGKTANNSKCPKCKGSGQVPNFGDSLLDSLHGKTAEKGNTDLGGPEPKMDKARHPLTGEPEGALEDSGRWPTKRKDILVPIIDHNRTEDELKEIGEKTTEQVELDSASPNDSGFYDGGETKGVGGTWHGDKGTTNPVTSRRWPSARV